MATVTPPFPTDPLVPNLRQIVYDGAGPLLQFIPLFMNKSLERLGLYDINRDAEMMFTRTLSYIPHNAPNLQCLWLTFAGQIRIHPECDVALAAISQLRVIWVPPTLFVASTLNILARLPHLEVLDATRACRQTKLDLTASSLADTFLALTTFRTDALSFDDIASLVETTKPRHLCNLDVFACGPEFKQTCLRLIATVASTCPEIEEINIRRSTSYSRSHVDADLSQSTFSFLSPTHPCLYLTSLVLKDTPCLCLNVETMKTLLSSFPSLETLELNERVEPTTLPLSALSALAELCPCMRFLSLCVDTERFSTSSPTNTRFDCLELLSVGISPLKSSAFHVASYLATILPDPCVLRAEGASNERAKWMPVIQFLPMMLELRTAKEKLRLLPS